ncbi:hypothetical protein [Entomospira culicis]|uniref:Uncharacterized protein n=1 Tax=Entomospira culicis TaxID=2719989 RepID=A0A968GJ71_9SPIO|nr:hypothetical protein [Entomospira culicis]NIZ19435.1 hypothetical protein [Entomospira culicis]NIZ69660.1 hypothetical protein [Entomospira culicis]WDI36771.1 hypothetical protein PVA46_05455 [Entomospira culicis]WDI38400.1 hypothetical protein PVA47_05465 [Entomospira culicis]
MHIARIQKAYQQLTHALEGEAGLLSPEKSAYLESLFKLGAHQAEYDRDFLMLILKQTLLALGFTLLLWTQIKRFHHGADRRRSRFSLLYFLFIGGMTYLLLFFMLNRITIVAIPY